MIQHHRDHTECADAIERGLIAHELLIVHLTFLNATKIAITYSGKSWELNVIKEDRFLSLDDFSSCFVGPLIKQIIRETDL